MERKFNELVTPFEFSFFQISLFTTSKYFLYPGKFMEVFDTLQRLRNKFSKICQFCTTLSFSFSRCIKSDTFVSWRLQTLYL